MKCLRKLVKPLFVFFLVFLLSITTLVINPNGIKAEGQYRVEVVRGFGRSIGGEKATKVINNPVDTGYSYYGYFDGGVVNTSWENSGKRYSAAVANKPSSADVYYGDAILKGAPITAIYYNNGQLQTTNAGSQILALANNSKGFYLRFVNINADIKIVLHYSNEHLISLNNVLDASFDGNLGASYDQYFTTKDNANNAVSTVVSNDYEYADGVVQSFTLLDNILQNVSVNVGGNNASTSTLSGIQYLSSAYEFSSAHNSGDILAIDFTNNNIRYYAVNNDINISFNYLTNVTHNVTFISEDNIYDSQEIYEGYLANKPEDPQNPVGYNLFLGWYLENSEEAYNFNLPVYNDLVLYARFAVQYDFTVKGINSIASSLWQANIGPTFTQTADNTFVAKSIGGYQNEIETQSNGVQFNFIFNNTTFDYATIEFNGIGVEIPYSHLINEVEFYLDDQGNFYNSLTDTENINYVLKYYHGAGQNVVYVRVWNITSDIDLTLYHTSQEDTNHQINIYNSNHVSSENWESTTGGVLESEGTTTIATTSKTYRADSSTEEAGLYMNVGTYLGNLNNISFAFNNVNYQLNKSQLNNDLSFYLDENGNAYNQKASDPSIRYIFKFVYEKDSTSFDLYFFRIINDINITIGYDSLSSITFIYNDEIVSAQSIAPLSYPTIPEIEVNEAGKAIAWFTDEELTNLYDTSLPVIRDVVVYGGLIDEADYDVHDVVINGLGYQYQNDNVLNGYLVSDNWANKTKGYINGHLGRALAIGDYESEEGALLQGYTATNLIDKVEIQVGDLNINYLYADQNKGNVFYGHHYYLNENNEIEERTDANSYETGDYLYFYVENKNSNVLNVRLFKIDCNIIITLHYTLTMKAILASDGSLDLNICNILPKTVDYDTAYVIVNGKKLMLGNNSYVNYGKGDRQYYVEISDLGPSEIANNNTIQFFNGYGEHLTDEKSISVKYYLEALNNDYYIASSEFKLFTRNMLNYGAEVQKVYGTNLDNLANSSLSEEEKDLSDITIDDFTQYKLQTSGQTAGIKAYGQTLSLKKRIDFKVYFQVDNDINDYEFLDGENILSPQHYSGNIYYVVISNVAAPDIKDIHSITIRYKGEGTYQVNCNVLTYAYLSLRDEQKYGSDDWANPMRALYKYADSASVFKAGSNYNNSIFNDLEPYDNQKIRVAFVGDDITYGNGVASSYSYPVVFNQYFDSRYNVSNFGVNGAYIMNPNSYYVTLPTTSYYKNTTQYANSISFNPDIVVIMLGSNEIDMLLSMDAYRIAYIDSLQDLISSYKELSSVKKVYVASIPYIPSSDEQVDRILKGVLQSYQRTACDGIEGCEYIDIYNMTYPYFASEDNSQYFTNNYLSRLGHIVVGEAFYKYFKGIKSLSYYSYDSNDKEINKKLFYVNSNEEWGADPAIIHIEDGSDQDGYYYVYCTSGYIGTNGFEAWRSKNLTDWQRVGPVFFPDNEEDWCYKSFWAPKIIYNKETQLYYLFYSAPKGTTTDGTYRYDSYATSPYPYGPFVNSDYKDEPMLVFEDHYDEITNSEWKSIYSQYTSKEGKPGYMKVIGPSPFYDDDGQTYFFFVADLDTSGTVSPKQSSAWCIKLNLDGSKYVPDYSSLTRITRYGYADAEGNNTITEYGNTNEGPVCFKYDGKYYLTFLTSTYYQANYQTRLAVADSPMGPFTKIDPTQGGIVLASIIGMQRQGAGIRDVEVVGDRIIGVYMTFYNNESYGPENVRKFAVTEMAPITNDNNQLVIQANGPSVTPQDLPVDLSGYENIARYAHVTSTCSYADVGLLNDGLIPYSVTYSIKQEYATFDDEVTISFDFDDYVTLRAAMIYNAKNNEYKFDQVESITLNYKKGGTTGITEIGPIVFNEGYYVEGKYTIGAAAVAEFDEIAVNRVTIRIKKPTSKSWLVIPEIKLLGNMTVDSSILVNGKGALYDEYSFVNEEIDMKDLRQADSLLEVDGIFNDQYKLVHEEDTYSLYTYKGQDGIYVYADVEDENVLNHSQIIRSGSYNVIDSEDSANNQNFKIMVGRASDTRANQHTALIVVDCFGETIRFRGIDRPANKTDAEVFAWLRSWVDGKTAVKIRDDGTGYAVEYFIPYSFFGNVGASTKFRITPVRNTTTATSSSKNPSKFTYVVK